MTNPQKIKTPAARLAEEELKARELEASFNTPYTASLDEVLGMFNEKAWYAQAGYQATIKFGKDRKVTLSWKTIGRYFPINFPN